MQTLLALTVSGSALTVILLALRYLVLKKMPSTVYYYAWLLVLLRFLLPLPGLVPGTADAARPDSAQIPYADTAEYHAVDQPGDHGLLVPSLFPEAAADAPDTGKLCPQAL